MVTARIKQKLVDVLIAHPRRPYKVKAFQFDRLPELAIVRLTQRYCRVIHVPTGLTLTDTEDAIVAKEFIDGMSDAIKEDAAVAAAFYGLTWTRFMDHKQEKQDYPDIELLLQAIYRYTKRLGYVDAKTTAECRYKYPPEYVL